MEEDNFDLDYSLSLPQATITLDELCSLDDSEAGIEIFEPSLGLLRTAKEEIIDKELEFEPLSDRNTDLEAEPDTPHTTRSSSCSFSTIIEDAPTPMTAFSLQKLSKVELINLVLPKFGSEPKFEPEPLGPNSKFSSRFRIFAELNLRSSSRFSQS